MGVDSATARSSTLGAMYVVAALLLGAALLAPGWLQHGRIVVALAAVAAAGLGIGLLVVRSLPLAVAQALLLAGSSLIATVTAAAGGGAPSAWFAMFVLWSALYSCLYFPFRDCLLQTAYALAAVGAAELAVEPHGGLVPLLSMMGITGTTILSTGALVRRLDRLASLDPLTGVLNERGLRGGPGSSEITGPRGLLLLDIEDFSQINGALGRTGGDAVLKALAAAARELVGSAGRVGRLSADTFAVLVEHDAAEESLSELAHAVARGLSRAHVTADGEVELSVVVGAALASAGDTQEVLFERATSALAAAKREQRSVRLWSHDLVRDAALALSLQSQLRRGIARDELVLHFQPQYAARTAAVSGAEALVRWQHPERGFLPPGAFLPAVEHTSLMFDLTVWVLDESVRQAAAWQHLAPVPVSVNLSPRLLAHDGLIELVSGVLAQHGLPASQLVLEITETAVTAQPERAKEALAALHELGVGISLDDFGTGYTSLSMLADLPLDELKVDRRFVSGAATNERDAAIVRSVASLGHRLGFSLVAEGLEDEQTRALLVEWGYDVLQGFLLGRPVAVDVLRAEMARARTSLEAAGARA